jgi:hypothetical protein
MAVDPVTQIPSPADTPEYTAEEFIRELAHRGARVYRMIEVAVICLTSDPEVAGWLHDLGATAYLPNHAERAIGMAGLPHGGFQRERRGQVEWDFYIHRIAVSGDETIWDAAGRLVRTVEPQEFA